MPQFVPSPLVGWSFSPWPLSGSVLVVAGAILGWHGQGSWLNFIFNVLNFTQPPHFTFTFSYIICCHHPALLPDHGMPPWDLLPPSAAPLRRRPLWYFERIPPFSLPNLLLHWNKSMLSQLVNNLISLTPILFYLSNLQYIFLPLFNPKFPFTLFPYSLIPSHLSSSPPPTPLPITI